MRHGWCWAVLATAVASMTACGARTPQRGPAPDELVLELGGEQPSLRAQLVAMGRTVAAPRPAAPPSDAPPLDVPDPLPGPEPRPEPQLEPQSEWVLVELPPGETLIHLARRHLGDGRRFVDLLRWNGWTEQDARRLPEGQAVRVKRAELAQR